jgi:hypothetical protein
MDISETIVAAMIGAGATVAAATFQIVAAFRSRKADSRPKRSSGFRSALAVLGLVLGAAVAGFAYSELRMQREREETRAMEQRISDRLQALANGQLAQYRSGAGTLLAAAGASPAPLRSEAMVRLAACRSQTREHGNDLVACDAANANRAALCASVPSQSNVLDVQLFARAEGASREWEQDRVAINQDIGGARFVDSTSEIAQDADWKAVCASFLQWNQERGHEARIVVVYAVGAETAAPKRSVPASLADGGLPARAPDTEAVAAAHGGPPTSVPSDLAGGAAEAAIEPAAGAAQVANDPAAGAAQAAIAPQP